MRSDEELAFGWFALSGSSKVGDAAVTAYVDYLYDPFGVCYAVARWAVTPARALRQGRPSTRRRPNQPSGAAARSGHPRY